MWITETMLMTPLFVYISIHLHILGPIYIAGYSCETTFALVESSFISTDWSKFSNSG